MIGGLFLRVYANVWSGLIHVIVILNHLIF